MTITFVGGLVAMVPSCRACSLKLNYIYIPGLYVLKKHYEARRSCKLRINSDHVGFPNVPLNLSTRVFSPFTSMEMRPPQPGSNLRPPA